MSEHDFNDDLAALADSEAVIPGSPARIRLDERLRAARTLRASLRRRPPPHVPRPLSEPAAPAAASRLPSLQND